MMSRTMKSLILYLCILVYLFESININVLASEDDDVYLGHDIIATWTVGAILETSPKSINYIKSGTIKVSGVTYYRGIESNWPGTGGHYDLDGKYTTFSGIYGMVDGYTHSSHCEISIYGDHKLLAIFYPTSKDSAEEFSIDIVGVKELEVHFLTKDNAFLQYASYAIVNPLLTRDEQILEYRKKKNGGYPYQRIFDKPGETNTNGDIYLIQTQEQLADIGGVKNAGKYFVLDNDIEIYGKWTPIQDFQGILDGAGYRIKNLNVETHLNKDATGLFGRINKSNVTIKNLGVSGTVISEVKLDAMGKSDIQEIYAGGIIGRCVDSNVNIESCYFDGSVSASAKQFNIIKGVLFLLTGPLSEVTNIERIVSAVVNVAIDECSKTYVGGLIGKVDGNSTVVINNCYTKGRVYAYSETTASDWFPKAYSYAGGLVGCAESKAIVNISNNYSIDNVSAGILWAYPFTKITSDISVELPPYQYAGGLIGGGKAKINNNNYRLKSQIVNGDRQKINNTDITALTLLEMHRLFAYQGFDTKIWTIDLEEQVEPSIEFTDNYISYKGCSEDIEVIVDKDLSEFDSVYVDDELINKGEHYIVQNGSTKVVLLSTYLDSLQDGFHDLKIKFYDGYVAEEQFGVVSNAKYELPNINQVSIDGQVVYDEGKILNERYLSILPDGHYDISIQYGNMGCVEESIDIGEWESYVHDEGDYSDEDDYSYDVDYYYDLYSSCTIDLIFTIGEKRYIKNGEYFWSDVAPYIDLEYDRTMVPLRVISEALGTAVFWNEATQTVTFDDATEFYGPTSIVIGEPLILGLGKAVIVENRTFVPMRYFAYTMAFDVLWDEEKREIEIMA